MSESSKVIVRLSLPRRNTSRGIIWVSVIASLLFSASPVLDFKLSTQGTALDRQLSRLGASYWDRFKQSIAQHGVEHFTEPVHEEITQRIFGCEGDAAFCSDPDLGYAST